MTDPGSHDLQAERPRWGLRLSVIALATLLAALAVVVVRQGEEIERIESRLARLSGPEDRALTHEAIAALRGQIETLSGKLIALESSGPPASDDPAAAERLRQEWQQEIDALRDELAVVRSGGAPDADEPDRILLENDASALLGFNRALAAIRPGNNPEAPSWSENQALGEPDTEGQGDFPTAWASQDPDGGIEWLEIGFAEAVAAHGVVIIESYNPGAVVKVETAGPGQGWRTVWSGRDPATAEKNEFAIPLDGRTAIDGVRITLDTRLVPGWNEIDAVGLEVGDRTVWGSEASASSTFGQTKP